MEVISLNPTEQKRDPYIRAKIVARDKYTTFPFVVNGRLEGINYFGDAKYGNCHHISPLYFLKRHRPGVDPNHPLNLMIIDGQNHNTIHKDWYERYYGCNTELVKQEVYYGGKVGWISDYDDVLTGMAIIRSYDYIQEDPTWFVPYQSEIVYHYEMLEPDFVYRYRAFS